jgi:predicted GNAT family N-acyltransferase
MIPTVRRIEYGSRDYDAACALRHVVLRVPLGMDLYAEDLSAEAEHLHYGAFDAEGTLVGTAAAVPLGSGVAKVRQVAVGDALRGNGIGAMLMREVEADLRSEGYARLVLHARAPVVGFYERLGYETEGEPFTEVGIPHRRMTKALG